MNAKRQKIKSGNHASDSVKQKRYSLSAKNVVIKGLDGKLDIKSSPQFVTRSTFTKNKSEAPTPPPHTGTLIKRTF